jgi:hypothetical protein
MDMQQINQSLQISLEQEFQLRLMEEHSDKISREDALSLLIETSRLLMIKDNLIKELMKNNLVL